MVLFYRARRFVSRLHDSLAFHAISPSVRSGQALAPLKRTRGLRDDAFFSEGLRCGLDGCVCGRVGRVTSQAESGFLPLVGMTRLFSWRSSIVIPVRLPFIVSPSGARNLLGMPGAEPFHARSLGPLEGTRALRDDAFQKMCWRNNVQKKCLA